MISMVTRQSVIAAIKRCDAVGRERFRDEYGFGPGRYALRYRGRVYDSKAIVGVAAGLELDDEPLPASAFSGGVEHSARRLVLLGFDVRHGDRRLDAEDVALPQRLSLRPLAADLRLYVCRPTNRRSIAACYANDFGTLIAPMTVVNGKPTDLSKHAKPLPGLPYVLDNGAWACHEAGIEWREDPFVRLVERLGKQAGGSPGWLVLPDIVCGGERSLEHSLRWMDDRRAWLREHVDAVALAVQDGMTPARVGPLLEQYGIGVIFVGGSAGKGTPNWKWKHLHEWTDMAADIGVRVHVGRVNGERKAGLCRDLGVASIDGSSVTRFSVNATKMARPCDGGEESQRFGPLFVGGRK